MYEAKFKFALNQRVHTPFGDLGIVTTQAVDNSGVNYYVKTSAGGNWFKEDELTS